MKKNLLILATLVPLLAMPAAAEENEKKGGTISINGTGIVHATPDMATTSAGVQSRAKTAGEALADNNRKMQALFDALEKAGIEKKDILTTSFNIHPEMVYPKPDPKTQTAVPRIVGYIVNNQVSVKIRKLDTVGPVLTALVNAGSNNMSGLHFEVSNKDELQDQARKSAIADARHKAELYASEMGIKIRRLTSLTESGGYNPEPQMMMRAAKMEMVSSDVPVSEGSMSISISVSTNWELDN